MDDCKLLFCEAGLNWDAWETAEEQRRKVEIYAGKPDHDEAVLLLLRAFLDGGTGREKENEQSMFDADDAGGDGSDKEEQVQFSSFVKTRLVNYHVFETLVNRNRERDKILSMLRLVEFINRSTEPKAVVTGEENHSSLATRCEENWNDILSDQQIEQRYANMLANYKATLIHARQDLERGGFSRNTAQKLPEKHIPADDEIRPESKVLDPEGREKKELVLREKMEAFEKLSWHAGDEDWEQTYTELKESFSRMEKDLKDYARGLSIQYASALERRKKETLPWERESYEPGPDIETVSQGVAYDRETRLKKLKDSHIHSSLSFQDQLNVENALEQCNASIRFKMYCAKALSAANFFALFLLILALFLGHYVVLQPYVFLDEQLLLYALIYIAAAAVLLLSAWKLPALFFHRRIKRDLDRLRDSIELYIRGYFEKADYFLSYINLLNQLDYISRYGSMVTRVRTESEYLEKGVQWHLVQVGLHLDRLSFFSGLIELKSKTDGQDVLRRIEPTDYNGNIQDVVRCQVYWPQG